VVGVPVLSGERKWGKGNQRYVLEKFEDGPQLTKPVHILDQRIAVRGEEGIYEVRKAIEERGGSEENGEDVDGN